MRRIVRRGGLLPASGATAVAVAVLAVALGLQTTGLGLLPDPGDRDGAGAGLFRGRDPLPPLTAAFTGDTAGALLAAPPAPGAPPGAAGAPVRPSAAPREDPPAAASAPSRTASNDDVEAARAVGSLPYSDRADARTRQAGEPATCTSTGPTAWYRYTPPQDAALVALAVGSRALADAADNQTGLGVFTGSDRPGEQVGCSTRDGTVQLQVRAGRTYWFQVAPEQVVPVSFQLRPQGATRLASGTQQGSVPNSTSEGARLSADGSTLVFQSAGQDLHPGVDRTCRSRTQAGNDARTGVIVPTSPENRLFKAGWCRHLYARDLRTGELELLDRRPDGRSGSETVPAVGAAVSADGRFVATWLLADDVLPDDRNAGLDLAVRDRRLQRWHVLRGLGDGRTSPQTLGPHAPVLSLNGRYVVFEHVPPEAAPGDDCSSAQTPGRACRQVYRWDLRTASVVRVSRRLDGGVVRGSGSPQPLGVSDDGRLVTYASDAPAVVAGDTNGRTDVFQHDLLRGRTTRVSVGPGGSELPDGVTDGHREAAVTPDGRYVAFRTATPLDPADLNFRPDVYLRDVRTGRVEAVSVNDDGEFGYRVSEAPQQPLRSLALSTTGRWVAFMDDRDDLAEGDSNRDADVLVRDRATGRTRVGALQVDGSQPFPGYAASIPTLSGDGRLLAFSAGRMDGRPESGCYCRQVWTRSLP